MPERLVGGDVLFFQVEGAKCLIVFIQDLKKEREK